MKIVEIELGINEKEPVYLDDLKLEDDLNEKQKSEILNLLNEYRDCVAKNIFEIGKTDLIINEDRRKT